MVEPHSSNFRVITTNFLSVRKLRIITVIHILRVTQWYLTDSATISSTECSDDPVQAKVKVKNHCHEQSLSIGVHDLKKCISNMSTEALKVASNELNF